MSDYILKISAESQVCEPLRMQEVTDRAICALLDTDVTERLRVAVQPPVLSDSNRVLCYLIDGRGGEKALAANLCGTCLYHTGCPIYGDLVFVLCDPDESESAFFGMRQSEADALAAWLSEQFPFLRLTSADT